MTISLDSPNVDNYVVGKGIVFFTPDGGIEYDVGNVTEMEFTPNIEKLDHFSSRQGVRAKDRSIVIEKAAELRMVMEEWTAKNLSLILLGSVAMSPAAVAATGTLTAAANAADTETVTIGGKVYTFQDTLTNVDGNVKVGATAADSLANLSAAINLGSGAGTLYAAATTLHPSVSGNGASPLVVTAKTAGAAGNSIATTETAAQLSWGAATLTGGANAGTTANIEIFSENVKRGRVRFQGTNDIGPKWNFDFPAVEFAPGSSINPISEEWGPLEAAGEVLLSGSSFGTAWCNFAGDGAPTNTALPAIVGTAQVGQTLTVLPGNWTGNPSFTYQWQKGGVNIPSATGTTYVPVVGDIGATLTCEVVASNSVGSLLRETAATAAVIAA
jgi:hypothetical protein